MYVVVFIPLAAALYLGERFKTRPAAKRHTVSAAAFGMSTAQVLVFVFVPNSIVAVHIDMLCFPVLGILGLVFIPAVLLLRLYRGRSETEGASTGGHGSR